LVELNKAISLSGLTTLLLSFLPALQEQSRDLLYISSSLLVAHSSYSFYKFYSFKLSKVLSEPQIKQLSVALGVAAEGALTAGIFGYISNTALAVSSTVLGIAHFYTMEIDFKGKLQVRPYAYLPFPLAAYALYLVARDYIRK
jgi:hypothetical protein